MDGPLTKNAIIFFSALMTTNCYFHDVTSSEQEIGDVTQ